MKISPKNLIRKFHEFTTNKFNNINKMDCEKTDVFFPSKDKNMYPSGKIYQRDCTCKDHYVV